MTLLTVAEPAWCFGPSPSTHPSKPPSRPDLCAASSGELSGRTELFISGDHQFRIVDRLLTNFHLPRSSLLVMIDSFMGPRWRQLYMEALSEQYRFLSFGDAMLLTRHDLWTD